MNRSFAQATKTVDDIAYQLNEMNVIDNSELNREFQMLNNSQAMQSWSSSEQIDRIGDNEVTFDDARDQEFSELIEDILDNDETMSQNALALKETTNDDSNNSNNNNSNTTLIVTNVDVEVFSNPSLKQSFENLFLSFDGKAEFRYLKSFRRIRVDFTTTEAAQSALNSLQEFKLGSTIFKCYMVRIIKSDSMTNRHLMLPKQTRQFLISPPASPPENWAPITEHPPLIDIQLISAIANLIPGQVHELHPASETNPGIFVHVCGDIKFPNSITEKVYEDEDQQMEQDDFKGCNPSYKGSKIRIPPTPRPTVN